LNGYSGLVLIHSANYSTNIIFQLNNHSMKKEEQLFQNHYLIKH
jgi:hypothetical protein